MIVLRFKAVTRHRDWSKDCHVAQHACIIHIETFCQRFATFSGHFRRYIKKYAMPAAGTNKAELIYG